MTKCAKATSWRAILVAAMTVMVPAASAQAEDASSFHYDAGSVKPATYYAAISNLANAVMFSGLGEKLIFSPYERDDWLRRSGYVTRPPMPDMAIVGVLYRSGQPLFAGKPVFSNPATLRWKPGSFDRTLDPGAQAFALLKITSPEFHLQFHDLPENKIAALMMVPQARTLTSALARRLRNADGLFAPRGPEGRFGAAKPRDQAAVLWAASSFKLAGTSPRKTYWHAAYRDLTKPDQAGQLATHAFAAVQKLSPATNGDLAIAIAALARYALVTEDGSMKRKALDLIRQHALTLKTSHVQGLENIALSIFGLTEAGRVLKDAGFSKAAADKFRSDLMPSWDQDIGVFRTSNAAKRIVYTPDTVGAVVAGLNAMRWYGPQGVKIQASQIYPRFFEAAVIRSGLLRGSPLALVSKKYRNQEARSGASLDRETTKKIPAAHFAHPSLPNPEKTGIAPVFAGEVSFENRQWRISDPVFQTGPAMFLSHMLAIRSADGRNDIFISEDLLKDFGS